MKPCAKLALGIGLTVVASGGLILFAAVILGASFLIMGDVISEIPVAETPTTTPIVFSGGQRVQLTLHATEIDASNDCKRLSVDVAMMHAGQQFQSYEGLGFPFIKSSDRHATNTTVTEATLELPPGGMDQIRTSYRFEPAGCGGKVDGLVLQFRKPRF